MAAPASLDTKISTFLTTIYKEELRKLDHPREALTSVARVILRDQALILVQGPGKAGYRALTPEQATQIKILTAQNRITELEPVVREIMKNALSVPPHMSKGEIIQHADTANYVYSTDLDSIFKDKYIEVIGKCFQIIKIREDGNKLRVMFLGIPDGKYPKDLLFSWAFIQKTLAEPSMLSAIVKTISLSKPELMKD